jgi:hypothetical protein
MMENNTNTSILWLPERPSLFGSCDTTIGINNFYKSHCVSCLAKQLHNIINNLAADPIAISSKALILTKSLNRGIRAYKISNRASAILTEC